MVFLAYAPMAAHRAVAFSRRPSVPAVKEMVGDMKDRDRRETDQKNSDPYHFSCVHKTLNAPF